jgi:homoserine kinase
MHAKFRYVKARAYSSTANLGPGFDVFGLALDAYYDEVELSLEHSKGSDITIEVSSNQNASTDTIPLAVEQNSAGLALKSMVKDFNINDTLKVRITKGIPVGYGLGSSAASAVAAVRALDALYDLNLDTNTLIKYSALGEVASANVAHYDNVAASMLGGFVIVRDEPFNAIRFEPPEDLVICIVTPRISVPKGKTGIARSVLPESVSLRNMVSNVANASIMVAGFAMQDVRVIADAIRDMVVEPARKHLIPLYDKVKDHALRNGALAVTISGAGPSILIVTDKRDIAVRISNLMQDLYTANGMQCIAKVCKPAEGCKIIESSR